MHVLFEKSYCVNRSLINPDTKGWLGEEFYLGLRLSYHQKVILAFRLFVPIQISYYLANAYVVSFGKKTKDSSAIESPNPSFKALCFRDES
jgi:hypothetical protein